MYKEEKEKPLVVKMPSNTKRSASSSSSKDDQFSQVNGPTTTTDPTLIHNNLNENEDQGPRPKRQKARNDGAISEGSDLEVELIHTDQTQINIRDLDLGIGRLLRQLTDSSYFTQADKDFASLPETIQEIVLTKTYAPILNFLSDNLKHPLMKHIKALTSAPKKKGKSTFNYPSKAKTRWNSVLPNMFESGMLPASPDFLQNQENGELLLPPKDSDQEGPFNHLALAGSASKTPNINDQRSNSVTIDPATSRGPCPMLVPMHLIDQCSAFEQAYYDTMFNTVPGPHRQWPYKTFINEYLLNGTSTSVKSELLNSMNSSVSPELLPVQQPQPTLTETTTLALPSAIYQTIEEDDDVEQGWMSDSLLNPNKTTASLSLKDLFPDIIPAEANKWIRAVKPYNSFSSDWNLRDYCAWYDVFHGQFELYGRKNANYCLLITIPADLLPATIRRALINLPLDLSPATIKKAQDIISDMDNWTLSRIVGTLIYKRLGYDPVRIADDLRIGRSAVTDLATLCSRVMDLHYCRYDEQTRTQFCLSLVFALGFHLNQAGRDLFYASVKIYYPTLHDKTQSRSSDSLPALPSRIGSRIPRTAEEVQVFCRV